MSRRAQEAQEEAEKHAPKIPRKAGEEVEIVPSNALASMDILEFK